MILCTINSGVIFSPPRNPIVIGRMGGAYGILGWIKIISFTERMDDIFNYSPWFITYQSRWRLMQVETWKLSGKHRIAKIVEISDRETAMSLAQSKLIVDEDKFPKLINSDEYYWKDIIGCQVITKQGVHIGYVFRIIETDAHDVLVLKTINNKFVKSDKDYFIPFVHGKIIKDINLMTNVIIVDWDV